MAVTDSVTLVLRFADLGVATYASLRVVGRPWRTVTWVIEEPLLLAACAELAGALPDPQQGETQLTAIERALSTGGFADPGRELTLAYILGVLLISAPAWQLLAQSPGGALFVAPSARLASVPWTLLALPTSGPTPAELVAARHEAITTSGTTAARIPWQLADVDEHTDGRRLLDLVDVLLAVPANVANMTRPQRHWSADAPPLLVLDPRVPGQRPDSALGSVLGRPDPDGALTRHFGRGVEVFRRADADRTWLADQLAGSPGRLVYVGHASVADGDLGIADRAALHLACSAALPGAAAPVGVHRPLSAADIRVLAMPIPPRVALLACGSGADYRFDEATGLVAVMVLGGAQVVTATLWSLPTTAGFRRFGPAADPMAAVVIAVDTAHTEADAGRAVNRWQRDQLHRWRGGDTTASPLYWAALATFTVDGAR